MTRVWNVPVYDTTRIRDVREAAEDAAVRAEFGSQRRAATALVVTEMATNLLKHGRGGQFVVETLPHRVDGAPTQVQALTIDHGPGISDRTAALRDGYSGTASLGAGLGTCARIADVFDFHSVPGRGTVTMARIARDPGDGLCLGAFAGTPARVGGVHVPAAEEPRSGDAWTHWCSRDVLSVLLADGLGHGPRAADAGDVAVRRFHQNPDLPPDLLLREMDAVLRRTRGAAVAAVRVDTRARRLDFAGVGNIAARLRGDGRWRHLLSRPGIVGMHRPSHIPVASHPWTPGSLLVMHSDGLPSRWRYHGEDALDRHDPATIAAVLVRDAGSPVNLARDDTTVAVVTTEPFEQE